MMGKCLMCCVLLLWTVAAVWSVPAAPGNDTGPACDVLEAYQIVDCYLIEDSSLDVLADALELTSNWTDLSMLVSFSNVADFPDDVFEGVDMSSLSFETNSTMDGFPGGLLRSVTPALVRLQFSLVGGIQAIAEADFQDLPFAPRLEVLVLQLQELSTIDGAAFRPLTALEELTVTETSVTALPADLLAGLVNLQELTLTGNPIAALPNNFFAQQANLKIAWLGQNELQSLEDGALDGLADIQMLSVAGNPFNCNCSLQWFKDWLTERELLDASGAACEYPYPGTFSEIDFCGNSR